MIADRLPTDCRKCTHKHTEGRYAGQCRPYSTYQPSPCPYLERLERESYERAYDERTVTSMARIGTQCPRWLLAVEVTRRLERQRQARTGGGAILEPNH